MTLISISLALNKTTVRPNNKYCISAVGPTGAYTVFANNYTARHGYTGLVHRAVCMFTSPLSLVLIAPTHGWLS